MIKDNYDRPSSLTFHAYFLYGPFKPSTLRKDEGWNRGTRARVSRVRKKRAMGYM